MLNKDCIQCGTSFAANRVSAKTCSNTCRKKASRGEAPINPPTHADKAARLKKDMPELEETDIDTLRKATNARLAAKGLPLAMMGPEIYRFVHTGIEDLDDLTANIDSEKVGGFPRGRITEIFGPNRSGKSSLAKTIMKNHPEYKVLFVDAEGGMINPPGNMVVVKGNVVEEIGKVVVEEVIADKYDLIIIDSVASLVTQKQFDDDPEGKASMARALNPEVRRIVAHLNSGRSNTAILFINQLRSSTNSFGVREYTVGGNALPYFASLRLEFRSASADKIIQKVDGKDMLVGQRIRVTVKKSRFGPVDVLVKFPLMYETFKEFDDYYKERMSELI